MRQKQRGVIAPYLIFAFFILFACSFVFVLNHRLAYDTVKGGSDLFPPYFTLLLYFFVIIIAAVLVELFLKWCFRKRINRWILLAIAFLMPIVGYGLNHYAFKENSGPLYPLVDEDQIVCPAYKQDPNAWFKTDQKGVAERNPAGEVINIYLTDENSEDGYAYYVTRQNGSQYEIRTLYYDWYVYQNGFEPCFAFGSDEYGYDIFARLGSGARLSLTLSITAALVNLLIGIIIGALEGYYGGAFDLIFERIKDILWYVPTMVFMTLFQMYFSKSMGPLVAMFFGFIFFGWISSSSTVRAQFYRYKGQEYVMAARTLGAKDRRLIFRHILPNAAGYIITASVLTIPGTIFSEATYSYLGIVNLNSATLTSVGAMLSNGQAALSTYPHCVFFPALFLSLLLICFNIFGNGLRDAFNPSLRGSEE